MRDWYILATADSKTPDKEPWNPGDNFWVVAPAVAEVKVHSSVLLCSGY